MQLFVAFAHIVIWNVRWKLYLQRGVGYAAQAILRQLEARRRDNASSSYWNWGVSCLPRTLLKVHPKVLVLDANLKIATVPHQSIRNSCANQSACIAHGPKKNRCSHERRCSCARGVSTPSISGEAVSGSSGVSRGASKDFSPSVMLRRMASLRSSSRRRNSICSCWLRMSMSYPAGYDASYPVSYPASYPLSYPVSLSSRGGSYT